jgi:predicted O-methyltransferase YrrM
MNKLQKIYKGVRLLLQRPSAINALLEENLYQKELLLQQYNLPNGLSYVQLTHVVDITNIPIQCSLLEGGSLPADYLLLAGLAKKTGGNYFEIGTWRGESVLNVAPYMQSCVTLNLPAADIIQMGGPKNYAAQMGFFSKPISNIQHIEADSLTFNYAGLQQQFSLIFIDGDHRYSSVKSDTENVFKHLVKENTIVVWHDYGSSSENPRWEVLRGIMDGLPAEKRKHLYAVSHTLCAIYYPFPVLSQTLPFPQSPAGLFTINISKG